MDRRAMTERFPDMVLSQHVITVLGEESGRVLTREPWVYDDMEQQIAEAQHEADMGHEVACPLLIQGPPASETLCIATDGSDSWYGDCPLCHGTGRVTLGRIVAADRARLVI